MEVITHFILDLLLKNHNNCLFFIITISVDSYEIDKAFTPFSCLLRLNNLLTLIKKQK